MPSLPKHIDAFLRSDDGPTTTEYAVMLALIIVICIGAISGIGQTVSSIFSNVSSGLPTGTAS
jgi:pilus assembly protein Flp/PilA